MRLRGTLLALPLLCAGLAVVAACLIVPAAGQERRLGRERAELLRELDHLAEQARRNEEFLARLNRDPELAERLAARQLNRRPAGERLADLDGRETGVARSPFALLAVPDPPPLAADPPPTHLEAWLGDRRRRLWTLGAAVVAVAAGLLMGARGGA